jgi:hypothetical protein
MNAVPASREPSPATSHVPASRLWMGALLRAIAKVPPGEKLNIRALREPLDISQADAIASIEMLVAEGRLDAATLRPPAAKAIAPGVRKARPYCQQPDACVAGVKGPCRICHKKKRSAEPVAAERRVPLGDRRFRDNKAEPVAPVAAPPDHGPTPRQNGATFERGAAVIRKSATTEAMRLLERDPQATKGRNASVTTALTALREQRASEERLVDPVERAKLALRCRGRVVFDASVHGGMKGRYIVSGIRDEETGKNIQHTGKELIAIAERVNPRAMGAHLGRASE